MPSNNDIKDTPTTHNSQNTTRDEKDDGFENNADLTSLNKEEDSKLALLNLKAQKSICKTEARLNPDEDLDECKESGFDKLRNALKITNKSTSNNATKNSALISTLSTHIFTNNTQNTKNNKDKSGKKKKSSLKLGIFLLCIFTIMGVCYTQLKKGVEIGEINLGYVKAENIFLQLKNKFILRVDNVDISDIFSSESKASDSNFSEILQSTTNAIQKTLYILSYFDELHIKKLVSSQNKHISLHYTNTNYTLETDAFSANLAIANNQNNIHFKINTFHFKQVPVILNGDVIYAIPQKELLFDLKLSTNENARLMQASGKTDFKEIRLAAKSEKLENLNLIKPYIDAIENKNLRNTLQTWIYKNVNYDSIAITQLDAHIKLNDIANSVLNNMLVKVEIENAKVALNKGVTPILSPLVELEFNKSNLKITPQYATFANMDLHGSSVLIANMPQVGIYVTLNGTNVRLDSNLNKLIQSYGVTLPIMQKSLAKGSVKKRTKDNTKGSIKSQDRNKYDEIYSKIKELNPSTTIKKDSLINPYANGSEDSNIHIDIAIEHNKKDPTHFLFSLQGLIQAKKSNLALFDIPLYANDLSVALDFSQKNSLVHVYSDKVKWGDVIDADINVLLNLKTKNLKADAYVHNAKINTGNLSTLSIQENLSMPQDSKIDSKLTLKNSGIYLASRADNSGIVIESNPHLQSIMDSYGYKINRVNYVESNPANGEIPNIEKFTGDISKIDNKAKADENVLKELKNNPIWDELKIRTKKTRPFTKLSNQELQQIAMNQIEKEKEGLTLQQDFLNIKNKTINLSLSFANDIVLDIPALSLYLQHSKKMLDIKVSNIEKILQFSPLAKYYGIEHGDFRLTIPYETSSEKDTTFLLNLTKLEHPLYTISNKRVTQLTLNGHISKDGALSIIANENLDFKSQDSLSMLRINGYKINVDEAYNSKIPFLIDLLKENKKGDLPYSNEAIAQELKLIRIKNLLRKKLKVKPTDFNIIGNDLQLTYLGYTIPFDSVNIRFIDDKISIDGQYGKGILNATMIKDNVNLKAKNFSADFVNNVLISTKGGKNMVDGGIFSVDLLYRGGILNGAAEIQNTALTDFKAVQNIFSFIDAVPSLFVFKNPHITTKGYQVSYGKVLFAINSDYIGFQNIFLMGTSMDINGWGIIDIDTKEMNMNLSISTIKNLSKFINKIPILGYLILGKEGNTISTNLILTGAYTDPKVHVTIAADIVKAPFNILRRIFTPVDLIDNSVDDGVIY